MNESQQAELLARWLEDGGSPPEGLDIDAVEGAIAFRPDLGGPTPLLSVDDLLPGIGEGPFHAAVPTGMPVGASVGGSPDEAPAAGSSASRRPWWIAAVGVGGFGSLVAAAAVVLVIGGTMVSAPMRSTEDRSIAIPTQKAPAAAADAVAAAPMDTGAAGRRRAPSEHEAPVEVAARPSPRPAPSPARAPVMAEPSPMQEQRAVASKPANVPVGIPELSRVASAPAGPATSTPTPPPPSASPGAPPRAPAADAVAEDVVAFADELDAEEAKVKAKLDRDAVTRDLKKAEGRFDLSEADDEAPNSGALEDGYAYGAPAVEAEEAQASRGVSQESARKEERSRPAKTRESKATAAEPADQPAAQPAPTPVVVGGSAPAQPTSAQAHAGTQGLQDPAVAQVRSLRALQGAPAAMAACEAALSTHPDNTWVRQELLAIKGDLHHELGQTAQAQAAWQAAMVLRATR